MQPKVSMVIPCYNKVKYIANMFNSILAQKWDSIELILVNDGSTDGTHEIIRAYEPKFKTRGYEVVIINQENQGLAAAVRNGLMRITGDFVCQVDADDELDPQYVSTMAGWLEEHPDYDWAACDLVLFKSNSTSYISTFPRGENVDCDIERWMLWKIQLSICVYMVRTAYFEQCGIIQSYYGGREGTQEAQIFLPLALGGGKIKYFQVPLYKYLYESPEAHLSFLEDRQESAKTLFSNWYIPVKKTIQALPIGEDRKKRLHSIAEIGVLRSTFIYGENQSMEESKLLLEEAKSLIRLCFFPYPETLSERVHDPKMLFIAAENNILGIPKKCVEIPKGRIIAWGALGQNARRFLGCLENTPINPTELWDSAGDGITVKKPDLANLTENDLVLVLLSYPRDICSALEKAGFSNIILFEDILTFTASFKFPEFYNDSVYFRP